MPVCQPSLNKYLNAQRGDWIKPPAKAGEHGSAVDTRVRVRVKDLIQREGVTVDIPDNKITLEDTLLKGTFFRRELRKGLSLHCGNAMEEHAFTANSTQSPGLSCIFFLEGDIDLKIGNQSFNFKGNPRNILQATAVIATTKDSFQRTTRYPQHVRHLVVTATPEWLNSEGCGEVQGKHIASHLLKNHLASHRWTPSTRLCELIREIFTPAVLMPELLNLYLESRAIEIVAETIAAMMNADLTSDNTTFTRHDGIRLQRARDLIATNLSQPLSVEFIAREAGISASGLQRLFRRSEGQSVFEYVRRVRLEQARSALQSGTTNVQAASSIAGYTNPANFATAFKRQFGMAPREVLRR